jgi:hypothetical protein
MNYREVHHSTGAQTSNKPGFKPNHSLDSKSPSTGNYFCAQTQTQSKAGVLAHS